MKTIEGSPFGPDKVAHALFCPALTFVGGWWSPENVLVWWLVSLGVGLLWELSNHWFVFTGTRGISILDAFAFALGWIGSGALLWFTRPVA